MKGLGWISIGIAALSVALQWAANEVEQARLPAMSAMMPDGALLYLEARDLHSLLKDWNSSQERRIWLNGDDYHAFSRSRLFSRLSQAQDEFSAAAGLPTDNNMLESVAGKHSSLGLYDIGNLEFVYVTRLDQHEVDNTPLWQLRSKFEQRTEGAAQFYVHQDPQSSRTAAFAARDGWLILATRESLVAGVLDRLQGAHTHNLSDEAWYADAVKQGPTTAGDLRMVLNLDQLVPSPYFRSYWVQRNITEMKQYSAAISDLRRTPERYTEDRVMLRRTGLPAVAFGDVRTLAALVPDDASFYSAQGSPEADAVLANLRENLLDIKAEQVVSMWNAPAPVADENAGSASMLEERIDQAPAVAKRSDAYQTLRTMLHAAQPTAMMKAYSSRASRDGVFVAIDCAMVIGAAQNWNDSEVRDALAEALRPGLTSAQIGVGWTKRSTASSGDYFALDGRIPLYAAVREKELFIATDSTLLEHMIARLENAAKMQPDGVTYAAMFRHDAKEQENFHALAARLDRAGHSGGADSQASDAEGQSPAFFSGNVGSLSRMFAAVNLETVEEKDQGSKVTQTVVYQWQHK